MSLKKLNLGCGPVQPSGWVNIDSSNRAILASKFSLVDKLFVRLGVLQPTEFGPQTTICNLLKPLPYADRSVDVIYAGELWEHFEYQDALRITKECARVLKKGGVLRVCVPDGDKFWRNYLNLLEEELEKPREERSAQRLRKHVGMYFAEICTKRKWFGSMGHTHKWQFDEIQLVELFESCGFSEVERMKFHESRITDVEKVERSNFLIVEGVV